MSAKGIRSIRRGLAVLQAINQQSGMSLSEISRFVGMPHPTTIRILQTLLEEQLIERAPDEKTYRPTALVQSLSRGYTNDRQLLAVAHQHITELSRHVSWPISIASRVGSNMVVIDSTFSDSPLALSTYAAGYKVPLLDSASGHCHLGFCSEADLENIVSGLEVICKDKKSARMLRPRIDKIVREVRKNGYATHAWNDFTLTPGKTSSIAVPLVVDGRVLALVLVFIASALPLKIAAERFLPLLKAKAFDINIALAKRS